MRLKMDTIMTVIVATAVLQNIAVDMNDQFPDEWFDEPHQEHGNDWPENEQILEIDGRNARQLLTTEHFARL